MLNLILKSVKGNFVDQEKVSLKSTETLWSVKKTRDEGGGEGGDHVQK